MADIQKILSQMTLDEKIGQLGQYNASLFDDTQTNITGPLTQLGLTEEDLKHVGSVLNCFDVDKIRAIQERHLAEDPNKIPIIFMLDVIHGFRTIFPIPLALGCSFDPELVAECSKMASKETSACGVHATFTPMVDYVRDPRWGRVMETCGEEPLLNGIMGAAQVKAFQGDDLKNIDNVATCVKHFAAYGGAEAGRDYNTVDVSERLLREAYLPAYKACIDAGTTMVMPSFNSLNGMPATANKWLMQQILREEWGYDGLVVSDYGAVSDLVVHGVAADDKEAARMAFECECDMEMCSSTYIHHLKELIQEGVFTEEQLDKAVLRILELKDRLGLFEDPYRGGSREKYEALCLSDQSRALVRKAAAECAVLLKNNGILPFAPDAKKVAVIGPFATEHAIIGFWSCSGVNDESITMEEGIRNALPDAHITAVAGCGKEWNDLDRSGFGDAVAAAKAADIVVLCLGEPQDYSGEGNCRTDLGLPGVQLELAKQVVEANPNTAVVLFNGRPLAIPELDAVAPAILDMWFPGTEGGNAAADLLFGKVNPSGKVSMTFPKTVGQCPIYYNHPSATHIKPADKDLVRMRYCSNYIDSGNLPLYSFGYGLSYSKFVYEDLVLNTDKMTADGAIEATVILRNDGDVSGKETVQLYMRDMVASAVRPVQQLIAFEKVELAPGERKEVRFTVTEPMLRFWNFENQYVSEPGLFRLSTGYADHLLHTKEFVLK